MTDTRLTDTQSPVLYRAIPRGTLPTYGQQVVDGDPCTVRSHVTWQRSIADIETRPYRRLRAIAVAAFWASIADTQTHAAQQQ